MSFSTRFPAQTAMLSRCLHSLAEACGSPSDTRPRSVSSAALSAAVPGASPGCVEVWGPTDLGPTRVPALLAGPLCSVSSLVT